MVRAYKGKNNIQGLRQTVFSNAQTVKCASGIKVAVFKLSQSVKKYVMAIGFRIALF